MTDLTASTALGLPEPAQETLGAFTIRENVGVALASLALRRDTPQPSPFGLALPGPGEWVAGDSFAAFWTGPGQWMVEAPGPERDIASELSTVAPGCSVTEQTDSWVVYEITSNAGGAAVTRLLEKLVNVDAGRVRPGYATRTGLEHMSIFVIRRSDERLAVLGMRSAAGSLWHALTHAAARIEGGGV